MLSLRHSQAALFDTIFLDRWSIDSKVEKPSVLCSHRHFGIAKEHSGNPAYFQHETTLHNSQTTDIRSSLDSFVHDIAESGT